LDLDGIETNSIVVEALLKASDEDDAGFVMFEARY
jgi:hypothetical protein